MRIALLFDNTPRPETTGFLVRRAFAQFADAEQFLPCEFDQLARGEHGPFDLFLAIDDGLDYAAIPGMTFAVVVWRPVSAGGRVLVWDACDLAGDGRSCGRALGSGTLVVER